MDPALRDLLLRDLIDLGLYIGMGIVGWQIAHRAERVVPICNFGKPPKSPIYIRIMRIAGWLLVASACLCVALFPFSAVFEIYARR